MNYQICRNTVQLGDVLKSEMQQSDLNALNGYFNQKSITDTINSKGLTISPLLVSNNESQYLLKSLFELQKHTNELNPAIEQLSISDEMLKCYSNFSEKFTEFGKSIESTYSQDSSIEYLAKDDLKFLKDIKEIALNSLNPFNNAKSNFGQLNLSEDFQNKASLAVSAIENRIEGISVKQAPEINKSNTFSLGSVER